MMLRIYARVAPGDELSSEPYTSLGIDVQASPGAPGGKCIRIDIDFLEGVAITPQLVGKLFGELVPLVIACGGDRVLEQKNGRPHHVGTV